MKAVCIHRHGAEDVLQYEDAPTPEPGPRDLLVKIEAAALNRSDLSQREGRYRAGPAEFPLILGLELAGTVVAVGADVQARLPDGQAYQPGQRVVANPGSGSYAEYALVRPSVARPIPDGISSVEAAAVPVVFLTAWFALRQEAGLKSGETALIQSGGSGVGIAAIQIAKHVGARVITTAGSDDKCAKARDLGADEAIDYSAVDFAQEVMRLTGGRGVDVVLESVGADVYGKSLGVLAPGGRLVSVGRSAGPIPDPPPAPPEGRTATGFSLYSLMPPRGSGLDELKTIFDLVLQKKLQVVVDRTFPLAQAAEAHRYLAARRNFGKVVLVV